MDEHLKKVQQEVDAMNRVFEGKGQTEPPATDAPGTEAPKTETPVTEAPKDETEAPKTESPKTEVPTTDAPKVDEKDKTIAELRAQLIEKDAKKTPITEAPLVIEPQDFVGDLDPEDIIRDKDALNKLLNTVYSKGVTDAHKVTKAYVPGVVGTTVEQMKTLEKLTGEFYTANEDLEPWKASVSTVFGELAAADPKKSIPDVLKETATEVRKRLNLPEPTKKTNDRKKETPPRLPNKGNKSGRIADEKPKTGIEAEIDSMNAVIGR